jgi:hypothetical protein
VAAIEKAVVLGAFGVGLNWGAVLALPPERL